MTDPSWSVTSLSSDPPMKSITNLKTTASLVYSPKPGVTQEVKTIVLESQTQRQGKCLLSACSVSHILHREAPSDSHREKRTPALWQLSLAFSVSQAEIRIEWEPKLLRPSYHLWLNKPNEFQKGRWPWS